MRKKISFIVIAPDASVEEPNTEFVDIPEITKVKSKISELTDELDSMNKILEEELSKEEISKDNVTLLFTKQRHTTNSINEFRNSLEHFYDFELKKLTDESRAGKLNTQECKQLNEEIERFTKLLDCDLENVDKSLKDVDTVSKLKLLPEEMSKSCPLLYSIVEVLLLTKADGSIHEGVHVKSAFHALSILVGLRSQLLHNNFKLMFTALCVLYGAGDRFITTLNHLGFTISWKAFMSFLDCCLNAKLLSSQKIGDTLPIILLMDNINMYKGKKKHLGLLKYHGPTMWNFTGRALIIPSMSNLNHLLSQPEKCLNSQKDVLTLDGKYVFIESELEKVALWQRITDRFLLQLLDDGLNNVPPSTGKALEKMNEQECTKWLQEHDFNSSVKKVYYKSLQPGHH